MKKLLILFIFSLVSLGFADCASSDLQVSDLSFSAIACNDPDEDDIYGFLSVSIENVGHGVAKFEAFDEFFSWRTGPGQYEENGNYTFNEDEYVFEHKTTLLAGETLTLPHFTGLASYTSPDRIRWFEIIVDPTNRVSEYYEENLFVYEFSFTNEDCP